MTPAFAKALALHAPRGALPAHPNEDESTAFRLLNRYRASITNDDWPLKVMAFHRLYNMPGGSGAIAPLSSMRKILRERLLAEEVRETNEASEAGDIIETVDGLLDTIYVAIGWMLELGLSPEQINRAFEEVHASNMTKTDDAGNPIFDEGGKVLKGSNYERVDLHVVLDIPADLG